jgi:sortase A
VPVRVAIPSLEIDATVEQVGVDQDGNMATPEDPWNTGWYAPGVRPGQPGNAAIAGHVDYHNIGPVVFWRLNEIAVGAEVIVTTDSGQTLRFMVRSMEFYDPANAPLAAIFGPGTSPNLNLITCSGTFDPNTRHYDERLVVFTTYVGP